MSKARDTMRLKYLCIVIFVESFRVCTGISFPPTTASWLDVGPVLMATEPWEENAIEEPQVYWDTDLQEFRMYYRGGWGNQSVGVATSKTGIYWTKYKHNPVYGGGGSNVMGFNEGGQPFVFREGKDSYWLYTTAQSASHRKMNIAFSKDGYFWEPQNSTIRLPAGCWLWGNRVVWKETSSGTFSSNISEPIFTEAPSSSHFETSTKTTVKEKYFMLQEAALRGGVWNIFLYTSDDGLNWEIGNYGAALSTLAMGLGGGMFGGPSFANVNGTLTPRNSSGLYNLWYHASPAGRGDLPTDIYHAASKDLITWKISLCENPVLRHSGKDPEYDQVADPSPIITPDGGALLYYDADNNYKATASIGVAVVKSMEDSSKEISIAEEIDVIIDMI